MQTRRPERRPPRRRRFRGACGLWIVGIAACAAAAADEPATTARPAMRALAPAEAGGPPSAHEQATGRRELRRRFREPLSHAHSAAGATAAAETLLATAAEEPDRTLKWLMLDEARRLGESAGQAAIVSHAIAAAAAAYDFDAIAAELRSLGQIPLRPLDARRASRLAAAAEALATRAETDGRPDDAAAAAALACRAWQRAGNGEAARRAAARLAELEAR